MANTLAEAIADDRPTFDELHEGYGPDLGIVRELIGVVPNCDPYLEIWSPGFRTYNLIVPNFLNLPQSLLGVGGPKDVVGLGMYLSSRAASCNYCSAHTCSYALRRGIPASAVTGVARSEAEQAAATVAEALSYVPHSYDPSMGAELHRHFSPSDAEWIVMGVAMMGFLNKFMDALGVELEQDSVNDVAALIEPTGWEVGQHAWGGADSARRPSTATPPPTDSMSTKWRVMRNAPGAIKLERGWMKGVPSDARSARAFIADRYGYDQPVITSLRHPRTARALATSLRHNLDPTQSRLGIGLKALVGLVFARVAGNQHLESRARELAKRHNLDQATIDDVAAFAVGEELPALGPGDDARTRAALTVARAVSPSPATVDSSVVTSATEHLTSAEIVELVVWTSVSQLMHRLSVYYGLQAV